MHHKIPALAGVASLIVAAVCSATAPATATIPAHVPATVDAPWPTYQHDAARLGAVSGVTFRPSGRTWSVNLGGAVRGEAVAADGRVFAATETNRVVALDPASGKVLWSRVVGTPVRGIRQLTGCGNIDPLGITSTPVIDPVKHVVYVVAEISDGGTNVHHQLIGLSTTTGAVVVSKRADPPLPAGQKAINLLQRAALALANGRVYVAYGGNAGDCGVYHGWLVGVPTGSGSNVSFMVAPNTQGGAIWSAGAGPSTDASAHVFVTTGNSNPWPATGDPGTYSESAIKLTASLSVLASFKDPVASRDADLATGGPVLLPSGYVFVVGKTQRGYILRQSNLTRAATITGVCGSDPDGGNAFDNPRRTIFVPCRKGGLQPIKVNTHVLLPKLTGANSTPIIVGDRIIAVNYVPAGTTTNGTVWLYDLGTRKLVKTMPMPTPAPTFTSPSYAYGRLFVPTANGLAAYK